jgi:hypothetical protein
MVHKKVFACVKPDGDGCDGDHEIVAEDPAIAKATKADDKLTESESKPAPHGIPSPYLVHCHKDKDFGSCGASSYLTEEEYLRQYLDRGWRCPRCHCHPCEFDSENYERFF